MNYKHPICPVCGYALIPEIKMKSYRDGFYHWQAQWLGRCPACNDNYKWLVTYVAEEATEPDYIEHTED